MSDHTSENPLNESLRRELEQELRRVRQEQRELSIIEDKREYWKLAGMAKGLQMALGVRSYKDRWLLRDNGGFGNSRTGRCGYCGGTIRDKSGGGREPYIRLVCTDCGFEDEKDVS